MTVDGYFFGHLTVNPIETLSKTLNNKQIKLDQYTERVRDCVMAKLNAHST